MALHIKALNNDTSFFLTFIPSIVSKDQKFPETFPGAFTILIDPWIVRSAEIIGPRFSHQELVGPVCIASLDELPEPDMILVSQTQPDHCHEETMTQLSPHTESLIVGPATVARKIMGWRHFSIANIHALKRFKRGKDDAVFRVEIPPPSPAGTPGEITISLLCPKPDFSGGLHNAIGITYRAPCCVLSPTSNHASNPSPHRAFGTDYEEKTLSVLYSPHGLAYNVIDSWAKSHLVQEAALPLLAMVHSTTIVDVPWYFGGNMATGCPGGLVIARNLLPTVWIAAHDAGKAVTGFTSSKIWKTEYDIADAQRELWAELEAAGSTRRPEILRIVAGETLRVDDVSASKIGELTTSVLELQPEKNKAGSIEAGNLSYKEPSELTSDVGKI